MPGKSTTPLATRFWSKVDTSGDCWLWTAYLRPDGYGEFRVGGRAGRSARAHRVVYELVNGPIPDGLSVCHRCDNRRCVNPAHLFLGTAADNAADRDGKGRGHGPYNPSHHKAKLIAQQIADIRAALAEGKRGTAARLARQYGVSQHCISLIRHGRTYR